MDKNTLIRRRGSRIPGPVIKPNAEFFKFGSGGGSVWHGIAIF